MTRTPHAPPFDATLSLLHDPYRFIARTARALGSDVFPTRVMLRRAVCMTGPEAAATFYDSALFHRHGAAPRRFQKTLFGVGGVQSLDGPPHLHRKQLLLRLLNPERRHDLLERIEHAWLDPASWPTHEPISLYDNAVHILTRAVCSWAGLDIPESDLPRRAAQLRDLFEGAGAIGPRHWRSRRSRRRSERWLADAIVRQRTQSAPATDTPLSILAHHRDVHNNLLDPRIAAVELLNLLRPTVAVAVYITFIAHALHVHREVVNRDTLSDEHGRHNFVQEVRRFYPFFPVAAARVSRDFEWNGHHFRSGHLALLDLYGTNHDPRTWTDPDRFDPTRFAHWTPNPFTFIPQGGGDHEHHHRCAGEWLTIEIMQLATRLLTQRMTFQTPPQDMDIDFARLPALPRDRMQLASVKILSPLG